MPFDFFASILTDRAFPFEIDAYLYCIAAALVCGVMAAIGGSVRSRATRSFTLTLLVLPVIVTTVIMMVSDNIGAGIAVAGAFSLIRFRSVPAKARDIVAVFLSMTAGLTCASGYVGLALLFTAIVSALLVLLALIPSAEQRTMHLHITIPESLRFAGAFDDLFQKYTASHQLIKAKTSNMGSLYKLLYRVQLKDAKQMQEFIDELRCRNGNLEIALSEILNRADEL